MRRVLAEVIWSYNTTTLVGKSTWYSTLCSRSTFSHQTSFLKISYLLLMIFLLILTFTLYSPPPTFYTYVQQNWSQLLYSHDRSLNSTTKLYNFEVLTIFSTSLSFRNCSLARFLLFLLSLMSHASKAVSGTLHDKSSPNFKCCKSSLYCSSCYVLLEGNYFCIFYKPALGLGHYKDTSIQLPSSTNLKPYFPVLGAALIRMERTQQQRDTCNLISLTSKLKISIKTQTW